MNRKNNIIVIGPTCSGKTTFAKKLEQFEQYNRIVTYTTRPKRPDEVDGVDYHFISNEEFLEKIESGFFAEVDSYEASFGRCFYGSAVQDFMRSNEPWVAVLTPYAIRKIMTINPRFLVYFLDVSREIAINRGVMRGDDVNEVTRRYDSDRYIFDYYLENHKYDFYNNEDKLVVLDNL